MYEEDASSNESNEDTESENEVPANKLTVQKPEQEMPYLQSLPPVVAPTGAESGFPSSDSVEQEEKLDQVCVFLQDCF